MVRDERESLSVARSCQLMDVSRSDYYDWCQRPEDTGEADRDMLVHIRALYERWYGVLGFRRVHDLLKVQGVYIAKNRVRDLMRENQLFGRPSGQRKHKSYQPSEPVAEDLIQRQFDADRPNHKWVSDITEIYTKNGKLYLCMVRNLYDGVIVGWSLGLRQTSRLVKEAIALALRQRIHGQELNFHYDHGTQYTSLELQTFLKDQSMTQSMAAVGSSEADDPASDTFFGQLKRELKHICRDDARDEANARIHEYIVGLYNVMRRIKHTDKDLHKIILSKVKDTHWSNQQKMDFDEN